MWKFCVRYLSTTPSSLLVGITPKAIGDLKMVLELEIHPEECLDEIAKLGINSRSLAFTWEPCWQIVSSFFGYASAKEATTFYMEHSASTIRVIL